VSPLLSAIANFAKGVDVPIPSCRRKRAENEAADVQLIVPYRTWEERVVPNADVAVTLSQIIGIGRSAKKNVAIARSDG
jgi:hypothetical protein